MNTDICKYKTAKFFGYGYRNCFVNSTVCLNKVWQIYITYHKTTTIWTTSTKNPPDYESSTHNICRVIFEPKGERLDLYNDYPQDFVQEVLTALKDMGKRSCEDCRFRFKKNLTGECTEQYQKLNETNTIV